jgi:hypothetical protein
VLVALRMGPASLPVPRELPCAPGDFTGREEELARVRALLEGALGEAVGGRAKPVVISAIDGMAGIGKSALALQAAHEVAERFPDGQLYVDLRGASPGAVPLAPLEGLGRMLRSLGLESAAIPTELEEAAARLRSLAAGRRLLVVLDNARDARQVRPLLPASPTCAVLVTSRQVLTTLQGAEPLHLDVLPEPQAIQLLGRIAGGSASRPTHGRRRRWSSGVAACRWPSGSPAHAWPPGPAGRWGSWPSGWVTPPGAWRSWRSQSWPCAPASRSRSSAWSTAPIPSTGPRRRRLAC